MPHLEIADERYVKGDTMILIEKPLAILAALARQTWHNPLVGLLLMVAVCAGLAWRVCTPSGSNGWVVRKGGMPVLWECVVWHHSGLSTPPRTRPRVSRKSLSVPRL